MINKSKSIHLPPRHSSARVCLICLFVRLNNEMMKRRRHGMERLLILMPLECSSNSWMPDSATGKRSAATTDGRIWRMATCIKSIDSSNGSSPQLNCKCSSLICSVGPCMVVPTPRRNRPTVVDRQSPPNGAGRPVPHPILQSLLIHVFCLEIIVAIGRAIATYAGLFYIALQKSSKGRPQQAAPRLR